MIHETLATVKFPLVKYASNISEVLSSHEVSFVDKQKTVEFNNADTLSLLGLSWTPRTDQLGVSIKCSEVESQIGSTKRTILSFVSKIFNPLGILSPVTVTGKILIQDLWREELKWDDQVSTVAQKRFDEYCKNLLKLTNFSLVHPYPNYGKGEHQLVDFSDASESAYAAVIYLRTKINNKATSSIICSKTRIAPIKALTIPRLELLGALLQAKLLDRVCKNFHIEKDQTYAFSDSTITLAWIKGPVEKAKIFIRNRQNVINAILPLRHWHYVKTTENPADLATCGLSADQFCENEGFWKQGPSWIIDDFKSNVESINVKNEAPDSDQVLVVNTKRHDMKK